ncbi:MAG: ATP-dependent helicase HrpB [Planctomycetota bacterium]
MSARRDAEPLPVDGVLDELVAASRRDRSFVLVAPTGSGKSTRVAPALLDAVPGRVWLLQPRRVAARALARRIASERGGEVGGEVGFRVRMERRESRDTRLVVATTGAFLAELLRDPSLAGTSAVVLDEFHERTIEADLVLALLAEARAGLGLDLVVGCMSATLDAGPVARFLGDAPVVEASGRAHDVSVEHLPQHPAERDDEHLERALREWLLPDLDGGDTLVFLPGAGEIARAATRLEPLARRHGLLVFPLHGELPSEHQDAVFEATDLPKLVLATNVAETSITLPRVTRVVDSGLVRRARHDQERGVLRLDVERASRASLEQRRGRAGRVAPGRCLRLFSPTIERGLPDREEPEIHRADPCDAVLALARWGADARTFAWFEPPDVERVEAAGRTLESLGALAKGRITPLGERIARLPLHPRLAALLVAGEEYGAPVGAATAAALLSDRDPFERAERAELVTRSDVVSRVHALLAFERGVRAPHGLPPLRSGPARRVLALRDRLLGGRARNRGANEDDADLERAIARAYLDRLCARRASGDARARYLPGGGVELDPASGVLEGELFVAVELARTKRATDPRVRLASVVEREWLDASGFESASAARFDAASERVVEELEERWRGLVLSRREAAGRADAVDVERALGDAAAADPRRALDLDAPEVAGFLARVAWLADALPDLGLPAFDDELLGRVARHVASGRRSFQETRREPALPWLEAELPSAVRAKLDALAPTHVEVPTGSRIRLAYEPGRPPVLAVRIQELFGLAETPRVGGGRVPVLLHLLAPNGRPQQVTDDLASFWRGAYHEVRKELRRRYPRHAWPDDPADAKPERRPKPRRRD